MDSETGWLVRGVITVAPFSLLLNVLQFGVGRHDWTRTNDPYHVKVVL